MFKKIIPIVIILSSLCCNPSNKNNSTAIPIIWLNGRSNNVLLEKSALVLPVTIKNYKYYMQLDLGAYNTSVDLDKVKEFNLGHPLPNQSKLPNLEISLGNFSKIVLNPFCYSDLTKDTTMHSEDNLYDETKNIGFLGVDFFENNTLKLDFADSQIQVLESNEKDSSAIAFNNNFGLIQFTIKANNDNINCIYDSGSSAFSLILSQKMWLQYTGLSSLQNAEKQFNVYRPDSEVTLYSAKNNVSFNILNKEIKANTIEIFTVDSNFNQSVFEKNNINSILGNKLFLNNELSIDFKNRTISLK